MSFAFSCGKLLKKIETMYILLGRQEQELKSFVVL